MRMDNRCNSIQALRGIGFLSIFLYHAGIIPSGGGWGVCVFFVLSGFLLAMRSHGKEIEASFTKNLRYSLKKIGKLYPLHVAMTLVAVPLLIARCRNMSHFALNAVFRAILNFLLLQTWFPWQSIRYSMNNLSWFLSALMFLYFMFPWIEKWIQQEKYSKKLAVAIGCIWVAMVIYAGGGTYYYINLMFLICLFRMALPIIFQSTDWGILRLVVSLVNYMQEETVLKFQ